MVGYNGVAKLLGIEQASVKVDRLEYSGYKARNIYDFDIFDLFEIPPIEGNTPEVIVITELKGNNKKQDY